MPKKVPAEFARSHFASVEQGAAGLVEVATSTSRGEGGPSPSGAGGDRVVKVKGEARVDGTALHVYRLEEFRRDGWTDEAILFAFPRLSPEDLAAAWSYVARNRAEIDRAIRENDLA